MGDFEQLEPLPQPRRVAELSPQAEYYKRFFKKWENQEVSRVTGVSFCPTEPHRLAVVSGTKVGIWHHGFRGEATNDITLSKFKDATQCTAWRGDGKLLLAGDAAGTCSVFDLETKKSLRRFSGHGDAVTCAAFASADRSRAATGGRDGRLRTWDVATGELLQTIDAHSDCLKVLASGAGGPDAWVTAGHDGKVRLWDLRASDSTCVVTSVHGHPVEGGVPFPGCASFVSAGGPAIKVWDFASGGRALQAMESAHSKAVTAVCLDGQASVLLTAAFDGMAKLWHTADLQHLWTYRLEAPATCAAWRPDDKGFAVGMEDGRWIMRQFKPSREELRAMHEAKVKARPKRKVSNELRGIDAEPMPDDVVVEAFKFKKRKHSCGKEVDFYLKKFEYKKLLSYIILPSTDVDVGFAVVDELLQRGALAKALSDLDEETCASVLRWFLRAFARGDSLQFRLFEEALHTFLDHNRRMNPPCTPELTDLAGRITDKMAQELKIQEVLMETSGMFKSIMLV